MKIWSVNLSLAMTAGATTEVRCEKLMNCLIGRSLALDLHGAVVVPAFLNLKCGCRGEGPVSCVGVWGAWVDNS